MNRPNYRKQITVSLATVVLVGLALLFIYTFEDAIVGAVGGLLPDEGAVGRISEKANPAKIFNVIKLVLWGLLALVVVRTLAELIFGWAMRVRRGVEAPNLVRNIFSIVSFTVIFGSIFNQIYPGANLGALLTTSAIFGVIIGLALQDTLGNLFAGISLQADKPFQVGDVIQVGLHQGVVESITWRAVKIRTFANHVVILGNSAIAKEPIEVCPRNNLNARNVFFNTLYTDSPARTIHVVREAVREADNVSRKMTPVVRIRNLGDNGIDWEVKYWLDDYSRLHDTDALIRQLIWYAFRRAGISFAFPTRTLYVERKSRDLGGSANQGEFVERLAAVDIFAPLTADELARLAAASVSHVFAPNELVIRVGDPGSSMFVVHNGRVRVQINDHGESRTVAVLNEGDFFGEMALFTGEPRTANVVAMEETEVLEIGHDALKSLFETNPDLVESLSHIIAERRAGLDIEREGREVEEVRTVGLLNSIKRFFGLG